MASGWCLVLDLDGCNCNGSLYGALNDDAGLSNR